MIFNLIQYLRNQFPAETFYLNASIPTGAQTEQPDRKVLIQETGGQIQLFAKLNKPTIQVVCFDVSQLSARKLIYSIYDYINDRQGVILPEATADGTTYPEVETACIKAIQKPSGLGVDESGLAVWTVNFMITVREA